MTNLSVAGTPRKEMIYKLFRYSSEISSTLGLLMAINNQEKLAFRCFTLEDEQRDIKIAGKTRIPQGRYEIIMRQGSPSFGHLDDQNDWHNGMLWLQDVPNFTWIYIHAGNRHENTAGCILVGNGSQSNIVDDGSITSSRDAYKTLYKEIVLKLSIGMRVYLEIEDVA